MTELPVVGTLPSDTGTLYESDGRQLSGIRLINKDAGTSYSTVNLYLKKQGQDPVPLIPYNYQLFSGCMGWADDLPPMNAGDQIQGSATLGTVIEFIIG